MTAYWRHHRGIDLILCALLSALAWILPHFGAPILFSMPADSLSDLLSRWLAACLTLMGLIIATTGFLTNLMDKAEFGPLSKSKSSAQLWEILSQNLGSLFTSAMFCFVGSLKNSWGYADILFLYLGTFFSLYAVTSMCKLVWLMRSVLWVKTANSRRSITSD